jgi:hypothetical protein
MTDGSFDVRETVEEVEVSASRKMQLEQYEPIEASVGLSAVKPEGLDDDEVESFIEELSDLAMTEAEKAAMRRHEEYVREEDFSDD